MDQIFIKTPNPKCRLFLKIDQYRYLAAGVYLSEAPSLLGFCLGWLRNSVGSESGQIHSVKLLYICSPHNRIPSPSPLAHSNDKALSLGCFFLILILCFRPNSFQHGKDVKNTFLYTMDTLQVKIYVIMPKNVAIVL
jgi:hypothetical protein